MKLTKIPDIYVSGEYNIMCWVCGIKMKTSDAVKDGQGRWTCKKDLDEIDRRMIGRPAPNDIQMVRDARPEGTDNFLQGTNWEDICTPWSRWFSKWEDEDIA